MGHSHVDVIRFVLFSDVNTWVKDPGPGEGAGAEECLHGISGASPEPVPFLLRVAGLWQEELRPLQQGSESSGSYPACSCGFNLGGSLAAAADSAVCACAGGLRSSWGPCPVLSMVAASTRWGVRTLDLGGQR